MKRSLCCLSLAAAIFGSVFCSCQTQTASQPVAALSDSASVSIAYINTDSVLNNYDYAKKCNDQLNSQQEKARADFNQKASVLRQDEAEFQRKVQYNAFASQDRAEQEYKRIQKQEQELSELNQKLSADLMQEQGRLSMELRDSLTNFLKQYAVGRFSLVLSNTMGDNVLYSAPGIDITEEVVAQLNARYAASQK